MFFVSIMLEWIIYIPVVDAWHCYIKVAAFLLTNIPLVVNSNHSKNLY